MSFHERFKVRGWLNDGRTRVELRAAFSKKSDALVEGERLAAKFGACINVFDTHTGYHGGRNVLNVWITSDGKHHEDWQHASVEQNLLKLAADVAALKQEQQS